MKNYIDGKYMSLSKMIETWRKKTVSKGFMNSLICNLMCENLNLKRKKS